MRFRFADYVLDTDRRELTRGSERVQMGPQVFDLLVHLVENRERVVSKDDMLEAVWSGADRLESTLTSHINAVRKAIGDNGEDQRLIRTVARKGFRFVGEVEEEQAPERRRQRQTVDAQPKQADRAARSAFPTSRRSPSCRSRT